MPQTRWSKPAKRKLATMNRLWDFGSSLFVRLPIDILIKHNVKNVFDKGKIWGAFYIPEVEGSVRSEFQHKSVHISFDVVF